jgi:hypothetical protein
MASLTRFGQLQPSPATPPTSLEPPRDDILICPCGFIDFFLLLQIATILDLETNFLRRSDVSSELWLPSSSLACT